MKTSMKRVASSIVLTAGMGVIGTAAAASAVANAPSQPAHGTLTSQAVSGPGCASPIGLCATGEMKGTLNGPFEFVANSLVPADKPGVLFMTGVTIIHDSRGDVRCDDSAALNTTPGSDGELVGLCEVTGLTGTWAGASGYLQTFGTFDAVTGGAESYVGKIVLP